MTSKDQVTLTRIEEAFLFAFRAHDGKTRKGKGERAKYIVHPMDVASTLMKNGAHEDLIVAGLLHDIVEDTDVPLSELEEKFGARVAELVDGATEPGELRSGKSREEKKRTWRPRKENTIHKIKHADRDLKLLSCSDKLANIRDMAMDFRMHGDTIFENFSAGKEDQVWYYGSMLESFGSGPGSIADTLVYTEFKASVEMLRNLML